MESLISQVQKLSCGSPEELSRLQHLLDDQEDSIKRHTGEELRLVLQQLDQAKHSLAYLYFLEALTSNCVPRDQLHGIMCMTASFIELCSAEQVRLSQDRFIHICKRYKDQALQQQDPARAVLPLRTAIQKLDQSGENLSPLHSEFLLVCLLAKCYKAALSILEQNIFEIDQPKNFLLYCYYGGMVFVGLKRFEKALEFFKHSVTAPMGNLSAIQVESYKKFILVSLIHGGQVPALPKYTPPFVQRGLKSCSQLYNELANKYSSGKFTAVEDCINKHEDVFKKDNNLGLARQVLSSLHKRNIQRLTLTYLTLSLQDIAATAQLETTKQAEMLVLRMIQDGDICATINQKDGMVSFNEDPEQYNTTKTTEVLDSAIKGIISLSGKLKQVDEQLSCNQSYLSKVAKERTKYDREDLDDAPMYDY